MTAQSTLQEKEKMKLWLRQHFKVLKKIKVKENSNSQFVSISFLKPQESMLNAIQTKTNNSYGQTFPMAHEKASDQYYT